nr:hypothetical protein CFP56_68108 [Quercus suber]
MQAIASSTLPLEAGVELFARGKSQSYAERAALSRPLSHATEILETDDEDESDFEEYSPKRSFESVRGRTLARPDVLLTFCKQRDSRRRSQTTISSYDEATTPRSSHGRRPFDLQIKPVQGPKGPHLFRASTASSELAYDYALQMSPLLPKELPLRTTTGFSDATVTPITQQMNSDLSIATALSQAMADNDTELIIRTWTAQDVINWMCDSGMDSTIIECFEVHDINGAVLLDLQFDDLKELDIPSFGKRHQLWNAISLLRGQEPGVHTSPQPTPFQDTSRPCTRTTSRAREPHWSIDDDEVTRGAQAGPKKRRGRKASKHLDVITPGESVSIVAVEQLIPRPHTCAKGERCAKWRKQQRELQQLQDDCGIGRFPISPTKGGRIHVTGDPGNAATAHNIIPNVRKQLDDPFRPQSEVVPSVVASSDLLGPGALPDFALDADMLQALDKRDPQDNVRQFLNFQHVQAPMAPQDDNPLTPLAVESPPRLNRDPMLRSDSAPTLFPSEHHQAYPSLFTGSHQQLRTLPRLDIPLPNTTECNRNASQSAASICRSATASPGNVYRFGTPASEMDIPVTMSPIGPVPRNVSQSVPPNMQFHQPGRSASRAGNHEWRRPFLPAVKEGEIFAPSASSSKMQASRPSISTHGSSNSIEKVRDPAHHSPQTKNFGYGPDCTHAGWMKKRKTKMLRHEWNDAHCRLKGTQLGLHANSRLSTAAHNVIDTEKYAVACSSVAATNKLSAAIKVFQNRSATNKDPSDPTAFAFQLVPTRPEAGDRRTFAVGHGKSHHFAVTSKDERIDWMRELMLAKALQQKGKGYEVEINGVHA